MNRCCRCALLLLSALPAYADSTHVALHATSGSTTVTVFTAPDPLTPGPAEISILLGNASDDAPARGTVEALLAGANTSRQLDFEPAGTLLTARLTLPQPGTYRLSLHVAHPGAPPADFNTTLDVRTDTSRQTSVILGVVIPLVVIALFLGNQQLKAGRRRPPQ